MFDLSSDEYYNDLAIWGDDSDFNDSDFDESFDNWFDEDDDGYYGGEDAAMEAGLFGWDA